MNKQITTILLGIIFISLATAIVLDSGDQYSFELEEEYAYYEIIGNSTSVNLVVEQNGTNVTIITDKYSPSDSFEIVFYNEEGIIIYYSGGSSGDGGTCETEWECSEWSECTGTHERECTKKRLNCVAGEKPIESESCEVPIEEHEEMFPPENYDEESEEININRGNITLNWLVAIIVIILLAFLIGIIRYLKGKKNLAKEDEYP